MIPRTFSNWRACIENDCNITLTKAFAQERLLVLQDKSNPETKKIISLYGEPHLENLINWFKQI